MNLSQKFNTLLLPFLSRRTMSRIRPPKRSSHRYFDLQAIDAAGAPLAAAASTSRGRGKDGSRSGKGGSGSGGGRGSRGGKSSSSSAPELSAAQHKFVKSYIKYILHRVKSGTAR